MSGDKRGRGRPVKDTIGDFTHGTKRLVLEVFKEQERLGGQRGSEALAIRKVADAHGWSAPLLKRAVQREKKDRPDSEDSGTPELVRVAQNSVRISQAADELAQRTSGIPGHVMERVSSLPEAGILQLLRAHDVGGNRCPKWLLDALITDHEETGRALLAVIERAAPPR